jgi:predicted amino acid dehydrogenase
MAVAASLRAVPHLEDKTVAVVGARGSVGALCARLFARERPRSLILVGNPASGLGPLEKLAHDLPGNVSVGSIDRLIECDLVLSCAAAGRPILGDAPLRSDVVICDVARPPDAPESVRSRFTVIDGGLCALPEKVSFGPGNLQGLPDGIQLACLSETILLALAGEKRDRGVGDHIWLDEADELMALAAQEGFTLPPLVAAMEAQR